MRRERIVGSLKTYQICKNPHLLKGLTKEFLSGINPRITERHGQCAKCAVRKILQATLATPAHPLLCIEAMLQLCRDNPFQFDESQDEELIRRINRNIYFSLLRPEQLVVETQEGVV